MQISIQPLGMGGGKYPIHSIFMLENGNIEFPSGRGTQEQDGVKIIHEIFQWTIRESQSVNEWIEKLPLVNWMKIFLENSYIHIWMTK